MEITEKQPVISGCGRGGMEILQTHFWVTRQTKGVPKRFLEKVMPTSKRWGGGLAPGRWGTRNKSPEIRGKVSQSMDMSLSKLWEMVKDREAWHAPVQRAGYS